MTRKDIIELFGSLEVIRDNNHIPPIYKLSPVSCEIIADYIEAKRKNDLSYITELRNEIKGLKERVEKVEKGIGDELKEKIGYELREKILHREDPYKAIEVDELYEEEKINDNSCIEE
jgi:hypothetical protein